jgi:hypothetical protein
MTSINHVVRVITSETASSSRVKRAAPHHLIFVGDAAVREDEARRLHLTGNGEGGVTSQQRRSFCGGTKIYGARRCDGRKSASAKVKAKTECWWSVHHSPEWQVL